MCCNVVNFYISHLVLSLYIEFSYGCKQSGGKIMVNIWFLYVLLAKVITF